MANIDLNTLSTSKLSKPLAEATDQEIYGLLLDEVRERCAAMPLNEGKRKLYYISAEFLIGKLLSNNLIDLGLFDDVREQLAEQGWLVPESRSYTVEFGDFSVTSRLYDIDVPGYGQPAKNRLRLFDLVGVDDGLVPAGSIDFDKTALAKNLTLFLYPDDSDADGRLLRIYQQYFMVSNAAQLIIDEALERGSDLHDLADYAVVQINDTHPTMVVPELIRLLTSEHGIGFDEAVDIMRHMIAYTNHTILAEALEKWPPREPPEGRAPDGRGHRQARRYRKVRARRPARGYHRRGRRGAHGPHRHPLRLQHQRRRRAPHPDPRADRAAPLL